MIDIGTKPTYQASMRLKSGPTVRVTVVDREVTVDIHDDYGRAVDGRMDGDEVSALGAMCRTANWMCR